MSDSLRAFLEFHTRFGAGNAPYIESLYEQFLADPGSLEPRWRDYFTALAGGASKDTAHGPLREALARRAREQPTSLQQRSPTTAAAGDASAKQGAVSRLVQVFSPIVAIWSPTSIRLASCAAPFPRCSNSTYFGLKDAVLDSEFYTGSRTEAIPKRMKLRDMLAQLRHIYCEPIGAEFAHIYRIRRSDCG